MFNCLRGKRKNELEINNGMEFMIKRVRFTLEDVEKKSKRESLHLFAKVISINHPKFFTLKIKSNYEEKYYIETFPKEEFIEKIDKQSIIILQ
ncbi:hypothetical protein [Litchfieldia alkalitelluris]|uniref:hypothetical protein n=1 Tax=Litchfieldia alkalitelluris TaxID=304268 RepID=UPI000997AD8B|nr:hypothetical protein [Litchfieldia alkalitelluris]